MRIYIFVFKFKLAKYCKNYEERNQNVLAEFSAAEKSTFVTMIFASAEYICYDLLEHNSLNGTIFEKYLKFGMGQLNRTRIISFSQ